jgi:DNA modification methylase
MTASTTIAPYWTQDGSTIFNANCLDVMREMPDKSVDAVITDPPYGVGLAYDIYDDSFDAWKTLIQAFIPEALRVSRGTVVIPTSKFEGEIFIYRHFDPIWRLCWYKGSCSTRTPVGFKDWETQFLFGKRPKKYVHDHFHIPPGNTRKAIPGHPCPKPDAWADWFIERLTLPGDTVLDAFLGSGTTGLRCAALGRNFIGCDLSQPYCDIAIARIGGELARKRLEGGAA